jgi:hypothetical protein
MNPARLGYMPELRAQLRSGECGVSWVPPESAEVMEEDEFLLLLRDPAASVVWQVNWSPFPFRWTRRTTRRYVPTSRSRHGRRLTRLGSLRPQRRSRHGAVRKIRPGRR